MVATAWSADGAIVAGGALNEGSTTTKGGTVPVLPLVILNAQGSRLTSPHGISGDVMGLAFVPQTRTLLVGTDPLTAIDVGTGAVLWTCAVGRARSIAFSADGKIGAAGGWRRQAGSFRTSDGKAVSAAAFRSNVGGVAILPGGDLAVAVWGGTYPLFRVKAGEPKPALIAAARFAFHDVVWREREGGIVAAEEGGDLWLFDPHGKARARLTDAGTTVNRIVSDESGVLVGRMNRVVQRVRIG
jgi:hypothetical protein